MKKHLVTISGAVLGLALFGGSAEAASYQVQSGDTLWGLSRDHQTSVSELKNINGLNSDTIYIGQTLTVPDGQAQVSTKSTVYTVKSGDTLSRIGSKYGVSYHSIMKWNNLSSTLIYPGQTLKVSGETVVKAASTTSSNTVTHASADGRALNTSELVNDAKVHMGTPYVWGGSQPGAFDCSGFMHYVINEQTSMSRTNVAGYWDRMQSVSSPKVGDFVFFETYKPGPSHMGIYLGNNNFIHASSSKGVTISSMDNSYWSPRYLGAKKLAQ